VYGKVVNAALRVVDKEDERRVSFKAYLGTRA
jgi:hypothetical protein